MEPVDRASLPLERRPVLAPGSRPAGSGVPRASTSLWGALRALPGSNARVAATGEVVVALGRASPSLYVVERGALAVAWTGPSGRRALIGILGPGEMFGHEGFLLEPLTGRLLPEVRALVRTELVRVPAAEAWLAAGREPEVARMLIGALTRRSSRLERQLARTLTLPLAERLLDTLAELATIAGRESAGWRTIDVPLTQEALASLVGVTRESVNRAFRALARKGLLRRRGRLYSVADGVTRPDVSASLRGEGVDAAAPPAFGLRDRARFDAEASANLPSDGSPSGSTRPSSSSLTRWASTDRAAMG